MRQSQEFNKSHIMVKHKKKSENELGSKVKTFKKTI